MNSKDKIIEKYRELVKFYEQKLSVGEIQSAWNIKSELNELYSQSEKSEPGKTDFLIKENEFCPGWEYVDSSKRGLGCYDKHAYDKAMKEYALQFSAQSVKETEEIIKNESKKSRREYDEKILNSPSATPPSDKVAVTDENKGCKHEEKYRFIDRDGNLRCSDCHKVI